MRYKDLPLWIKFRANRNRKKYYKSVGFPELSKSTKKSDVLLNMFSFSNTPEGFVFWSNLDHFSSMEEVRKLPIYKEFISNRNSILFYDICFILSMLLYAVVIYFLAKLFIPTELLKILKTFIIR